MHASHSRQSQMRAKSFGRNTRINHTVCRCLWVCVTIGTGPMDVAVDDSWEYAAYVDLRRMEYSSSIAPPLHGGKYCFCDLLPLEVASDEKPRGLCHFTSSKHLYWATRANELRAPWCFYLLYQSAEQQSKAAIIIENDKSKRKTN